MTTALMPLFDSFFTVPTSESFLRTWLGYDRDSYFAGSGAYPTFSVQKTPEEDGVTVTGIVPGYKPEHIDVTVHKNALTIETAEKDVGSVRAFRQRVKLGESIDQDKINAKLEHGILTVTLPFKEEVRASREPKRIAVG